MQVSELLVQIPAGVRGPDTLTTNIVAIGATVTGKIASNIIFLARSTSVPCVRVLSMVVITHTKLSPAAYLLLPCTLRHGALESGAVALCPAIRGHKSVAVSSAKSRHRALAHLHFDQLIGLRHRPSIRTFLCNRAACEAEGVRAECPPSVHRPFPWWCVCHILGMCKVHDDQTANVRRVLLALFLNSSGAR